MRFSVQRAFVVKFQSHSVLTSARLRARGAGPRRFAIFRVSGRTRQQSIHQFAESRIVKDLPSVIAVGQDDKTGFPLHRRHGERLKSSLATRMQNDTSRFPLLDSPAERPRIRAVDLLRLWQFDLRTKHLIQTTPAESQSVAPFWIND